MSNVVYVVLHELPYDTTSIISVWSEESDAADQAKVLGERDKWGTFEVEEWKVDDRESAAKA